MFGCPAVSGACVQDMLVTKYIHLTVASFNRHYITSSCVYLIGISATPVSLLRVWHLSKILIIHTWVKRNNAGYRIAKAFGSQTPSLDDFHAVRGAPLNSGRLFRYFRSIHTYLFISELFLPKRCFALSHSLVKSHHPDLLAHLADFHHISDISKNQRSWLLWRSHLLP